MDLRHLRRPIHLILDWDGTLTRKDTLALVGQIGYHAHEKAPSPLPPWSDFVTGYGNDYSEHLSHYEPKAPARTTLDQERQWLASLTPIENRSVRRVEASAVFRGVTAQHVDHVAKTSLQNGDLQLRSHWDDLLQRVIASDSPRNKISILSVNWSERFIRRALIHAASNSDAGTTTSRSFLIAYLVGSILEIRANEITGIDDPQGSDGTLNKKDSTGIRTSADKLANMPEKCRNRLESTSKQPPSKDDEPTVIYVGDSATDLEALLSADIGICIRDEPMGSSQRELAETLRRIGIRTVHVGEESSAGGKDERIVYWANGYKDIINALEPVLGDWGDPSHGIGGAMRDLYELNRGVRGSR